MRKALWVFLNLMAFHYFLVFRTNAMVQEKAEATIPVTTLSPPEGNTTFLGGTTWCVARPGASPTDLQIALDWACGLGKADCRAIQAGGPCFDPDTLLSHASYAFNNYYQQNGNSDIACYFGGTAALTQNNPSHGRCVFATSSESIKASAASSWEHKAKSIWWKIDVILLLLYLGQR
ncbi:glucan endo-1,3-beta-glucosidase 12 [Sesamum indicum]|uniref:Glucan endo-1,3-beta-glucosidase 12 n=1 Tax=Sesamum indicum TaxID=4182 RepID=A0A6I9UF97_SESIN|nr:glucan endo-1,3-beta-glucosidase 12 [Sesamum indicum]